MRPGAWINASALPAWILLAIWASALDAAVQCGACHPEQRVSFARSIHAQEEVACVDCHGGDPQSRNVERAHSGDFQSLDDRGGVPQLCAGCHSDLAAMRPFNLPIDQYAIYETSKHGRAVARGETRAAVCSDCHGVHDIRKAGDPLASVHSRNVAATCSTCHSDADLMQDFGLDPEIAAHYRSGVHGVALMEQGNAAAPTCTNCHGVHGPAPPGLGDVNKVCGSCHAEARSAFLEGPHGKAMADAGLAECAACHSNHKIRQFSTADTENLCSECHGEGSEPAVLGTKIRTLISAAGAEVDQAEQLAQQAEQMALHVDDYLSRIEEARTYLTEVAPLVHAVTLEPVALMARRAKSIGLEVQHEIHSKMDRRPVRVGLALFWFYVLMTVVILVSLKRRLRARKEAKPTEAAPGESG